MGIYSIIWKLFVNLYMLITMSRDFNWPRALIMSDMTKRIWRGQQKWHHHACMLIPEAELLGCSYWLDVHYEMTVWCCSYVSLSAHFLVLTILHYTSFPLHILPFDLLECLYCDAHGWPWKLSGCNYLSTIWPFLQGGSYISGKEI